MHLARTHHHVRSERQVIAFLAFLGFLLAFAVEEIVDEYDGRLTVAKLNIDDNANTPPKYGIRGIPTLMLFKGGAVEATKVGALSKSQLTAFLDSNI